MPACTDPAYNNSNITILVTIIMLLQLYRSIFRTPAYLMHEACSKPCEISKMMRHIENTGIGRTVYSSIFRHNPFVPNSSFLYPLKTSEDRTAMSGLIFRHVQAYWGTLRHIRALLWYIEPYLDTSRTLCNPWMYNRAIFRTLTHLRWHLKKPIEH